MPNIIEQQDLLKGLPDSRLALLMQKPDGSIPPFLVAAEAQRRQAIRQQYAGDGTQESVVDTLTKQIANVPQNVQAPPQTPPNIPPPQIPAQSGGIGALQQQMAHGGPVRRFAAGGDITSMSRDEYLRKAAQDKVNSLGAGKAKYLLTHPTVPKTEMQQAQEGFKAATEGPLSFTYTPEDVYDAAEALKKQEAKKPYIDTETETTSTTYPGIGALLPNKKVNTQPRQEDAATKDTSPENKYKAEEAKFRKRIEDMYAADEPSNWENAQKWFAMSQAIMQPDQNIVQGLASAGSIYAQAMGEQSAAERAARAAQDEMLLKYDMGLYQQDRQAQIDAAAKADDRAWELQKMNMFTAEKKATILKDQINGLSKLLEDTMDPDARAEISKKMTDLQTRLDALMNSDVPSENVDRDKLDAELVSSIFGR